MLVWGKDDQSDRPRVFRDVIIWQGRLARQVAAQQALDNTAPLVALLQKRGNAWSLEPVDKATLSWVETWLDHNARQLGGGGIRLNDGVGQ